MNSKIQYHLRELEVAKDPDDPNYGHNTPQVSAGYTER